MNREDTAESDTRSTYQHQCQTNGPAMNMGKGKTRGTSTPADCDRIRQDVHYASDRRLLTQRGVSHVITISHDHCRCHLGTNPRDPGSTGACPRASTEPTTIQWIPVHGRKELGLTSLSIISPSHSTGYQLVNAHYGATS